MCSITKWPKMTQTTNQRPVFLRYLPIIVIVVVAAIGAFTLRDYLSFEALRDNREALLEFRDSHFLLTALGFMTLSMIVVAFSLPGAALATLTASPSW